MKITLKWFSTGKITPLTEDDEILNGDTTIAEVKALIQIRFGFPAKEVLLLRDGLLENHVTLRSVGLTEHSEDVCLTAHVIHASELESGEKMCCNDTAHSGDNDNDDDDGRLHEFSHADFLLAMRMIGKEVAVPNDRLVRMRMNAPRQRPALLGLSQRTSVSREPLLSPSRPLRAGAQAGGGYDPRSSELYQILANMRHGKRRKDAEHVFSVHYPGVADPFNLWDLRPCELNTLSEKEQTLHPGELCVELFYFGEFSAITDKDKFSAIARHVLEAQAGVRVVRSFALREAGCIYPLVGLGLVLHEMDVRELGERVFEDFGEDVSGAAMNTTRAAGPRSNPRELIGNGSCLAQ